MELGLTGKRALVTAASRGLGLACARALGAEGAKVTLCGRRLDHLKKIAGEIAADGGTDTAAVAMDLLDPASIDRGVADVVRRWGGLDILIANTPGPVSGDFMSIDRTTWREALDMTVMPVIDLLRAAIPAMKAGGGGRILCITTVGVKVVQPSMVLSNATRLAIVGIAKTVSVEQAAHNILVNALCPGPIDTDRMNELIDATSRQRKVGRAEAEAIWLDEVPLARMGRSEDFGKLAAVMVSDAASFVTGAALAVDGGKSGAY